VVLVQRRSHTTKEKEKEKREIQNGIELYLIRAVPNLLHELGQASHAAEKPAVSATTAARERRRHATVCVCVACAFNTTMRAYMFWCQERFCLRR